MKKKNYITQLHENTDRDYLNRMNDDKIHCMKIAKKYEKDYWDGDRRYGYGGYKYIPGLWTSMAKEIITDYNLSETSNILDLGCGKGYLIHEIKIIIPKIKVTGIDISKHAISQATPQIRPYMLQMDAKKPLPYHDKQFDLLISIGLLHNFRLPDLKNTINEINRVSKKSYTMVESYRNEQELFNLQCWALTAQSFFDDKEWEWIYKEYDYQGDYEFIYFK